MTRPAVVAARASGVVLLLVTGLAGCGLLGDDETAGSDAEAALEAQRTEVRDAAAEVGRSLVDTLPGEVLESRGDWEGCESAFMDEFRNFRYLATVRISGGADQPARALADLVADAGFETDRVEPDGLTASTSELALSLRPVPAGGASGDWLLQVTGAECVDVPEGERDDWLMREEPSPSVL